MFEHDARLAKWFADNKGIVGVGSASRLGIDKDCVARRHGSDLLVREHPGVYRSAAVPRSFDTRLYAAVAAAGDDAFVSGPSLMRLYDVRGEWSDRPELTLLGTEHLVLDGVRIRRIDRIDQRDIQPRDGLPALAPPLGLLLLGASASPWKVETAVHDMVFQGLTARDRLVDVLKRYGGRGRRGAASCRKAVRSLDPKGRATQTNMELATLAAVRNAGLPEPHLQFPVVDGDGGRRKLDLAWPDHGLDLETDGDRWHLNPADRTAMKRRDAALARVGYTTWRVDSADVATDLRSLILRLTSFFGS